MPYFALLLVLLWPAVSFAQGCPASNGNPCANLLESVQINPAVGNPVHAITGNKFQRDWDLWPRASGLSLVRYYNAQLHTQQQSLGAGWTHNYHTRLYFLEKDWQIITEDGQRLHFSKALPVVGEPSSALMPLQGRYAEQGQLHPLPNGAWRWENPRGDQHDFNAQGYLVRQQWAGQPAVHLHYRWHEKVQDWRLDRVQGEGEALQFHYDEYRGVLTHVDSPIGVLRYHLDYPQGRARLLGWQHPQGWQQTYAYEANLQAGNPWLLTGVWLQTPQGQRVRLSRWQYDAQGRAILSQTFGLQAETIHIDYVQTATPDGEEGLTYLRHRHGGGQGRTSVRGRIYRGRALITSVEQEGVPCLRCPQGNMQMQYDAMGRPTQWQWKHSIWGKLRLQLATKADQAVQAPVRLFDDYQGESPWAKVLQALWPESSVSVPNNQAMLGAAPHTPSDWVPLDGVRWYQQGDVLQLHSPEGVLWHSHWQHKARGSVQWHQAFPTLAQQRTQYYPGAVGTQKTHSITAVQNGHLMHYHYMWDAQGRNRLYVEDGQTYSRDVQRFQQALFSPRLPYGDYTLVYGTNRRIRAVLKNGQLQAWYQYDAQGRRLQKSTAQGVTQFQYQGGYLVQSTWRPTQGEGYRQRQYIYEHDRLVGFIDQHFNQQGQHLSSHRYWVYDDALYNPVLVLDEHRQVRWAAHYTPWGKAMPFVERIDFQYRRLNQYFDEETGLHDHVFRTLDPLAGHYLEPDPLSALAQSSPYGYLDNQALGGVDRFGLYLLAFDGTSNHRGERTNVSKFFELYEGDKMYTSGPGTMSTHRPGQRWEEALGTGDLSIAMIRQLQALFAYLGTQQGSLTPLDIIGFSRGSAGSVIVANLIEKYTRKGRFYVPQHQAVDVLRSLRGNVKAETAQAKQLFGNGVDACIDLRFLGLFDTVPQLGVLGASNHRFDLSRPESWRQISHAIALTEFRSWFPLHAYGGAPHVREQPFLGNHTDLGGVVVPEDKDSVHNPRPDKESDIGKIPFAWMHTQALEAGVPLKPLGKVFFESRTAGKVLTSWQQGQQDSVVVRDKKPFDRRIVESIDLSTIENPNIHGTKIKHYPRNPRPMFRERYATGELVPVPIPHTPKADRRVYLPDGSSLATQDLYEPGGKAIRQLHADKGELIWVGDRELSQINVDIFGLVNAKSYLAWLKSSLGWEANIQVANP